MKKLVLIVFLTIFLLSCGANRWIVSVPSTPSVPIESGANWPSTSGRTIGEMFVFQHTSPNPDEFYLLIFVGGRVGWQQTELGGALF